MRTPAAKDTYYSVSMRYILMCTTILDNPTFLAHLHGVARV